MKIMRLRIRPSDTLSSISPDSDNTSAIDTCIVVSSIPPETTLRDLLDTSCPQFSFPDTLYIDHHPCTLNDKLADLPLYDGSLVHTQPLPPTTRFHDWIISVSGGINAGATWDISEGQTLSFGRSDQADIHADSPLTSWFHGAVRVVDTKAYVYDNNSSNGTFLNGEKVTATGIEIPAGGATIVAGGLVLRIDKGLGETPAALTGIPKDGTITFNRPPRPGLPPIPDSLKPPSKSSVSDKVKFSWIAFVAPLVMAGTIVALTHNPRFALMALLSPVMAVGTWVENKRRAKKEKKESDGDYKEKLEEFISEITDARNRMRQRLDRMSIHPALAFLRASIPTTGLWSRKPDHPDALTLTIGTGNHKWDIPLQGDHSNLEKEVRSLTSDSYIIDAPLQIDLSEGQIVGVVGDRHTALGVIRSLIVQIATGMGPSNMTIGVFAEPNKREEWSWTGWLPHTLIHSSPNQSRYINYDYETSRGMLEQIRSSIDSFPTSYFLLVLDHLALLEGRNAPARDLAGHPHHARQQYGNRPLTRVPAIIYAPTTEQLPSSCTWIIHAQEDNLRLENPQELTTIDHIIPTGISRTQTENTAAALARFSDPEISTGNTSLPNLVSLLELLGISGKPTVDDILKLWDTPHTYSTPIGMSAQGVYSLDIVHDGPHGLVGGTTGSGKSEYLRSLIAGLAARCTPEELTFILVDFKGGAAFASLNRLPHTIGTLSNLDPQLALRAVKTLEAELRYRQQLFASAGEDIDTIDAYNKTKPERPLPRLLFVVDEFAQLATDYPDTLASLVKIAALGRTLGIHMILATQRPSGVVNQDILTNTNTRVALRVQSKEDSSSIIGTPHASAITTAQKGRAYIRLGETDITPIQTALITGNTTSKTTTALAAAPTTPDAPRPSFKAPRNLEATQTDLDYLIEAILEANEQKNYLPPRPVWPEELPTTLPLSQIETSTPTELHLGLSDDPEHQRQIPATWQLTRGNLLLIGIPGSGTSTALNTIALQAANAYTPEELDIITLDFLEGKLAPLSQLPHTSLYASKSRGGREIQTRTLRLLTKEVNKRLESPEESHRTLLILVDGLITMNDDLSSGNSHDQQALSQFYRIWSEGNAVKMYCAASTTRTRSIPSHILDITPQKWAFRFTDASDYSALGQLKRQDKPSDFAGRCVIATTALQTHIATPENGIGDAIATICQAHPDATAKKPFTTSLPERFAVSSLTETTTIGEDDWTIPIAIQEADLSTASIETWTGEHIFVSGPSRSGKSTTLLALAHKLSTDMAAQGKTLHTYAIAGKRSPLSKNTWDYSTADSRDCSTIISLVKANPTDLHVIFVDDGEAFDDSDMTPLVTSLTSANVRIVVAVRNDEARRISRWYAPIRKTRCGILLMPKAMADEETLYVSLPTRLPVPLVPGRGFICSSGQASLAQIASSH